MNTYKSNRLNAILFIFFASLNSFFLLQHNLWQDELQSLAIARNYSSVSDLMELNSKEGRFVLWSLILIFLKVFPDDLTAMKGIVFAFNCFSFYAITRLTALSFKSKMLVLLSFPVLFGLTVHVRDYSLMLALSLAYCLGWTNNKSQVIRFLAISFLALLGGMGLFLAMSFLARDCHILAKDYLNRKCFSKRNLVYILTNLWLILFSFLVSRPPSSRASINIPSESLLQVLLGPARAIQYVIFYGQTHISQPDRIGIWFRPTFAIITFLSLVVFTIIFLALSGSNRVGFLTYSLLYILYSSFVYPGSWWSHSLFYVVAIIMLALERNGITSNVNKMQVSRIRYSLILLSIIGVSTSVLGLGRAFYAENSFSNSSSAAKVVEKLCLNDCNIAIEQDITGQSISTHLQREVFYLNRLEFGTYTDWDSLSDSKSIESERKITALMENNIDVLVLTGEDLLPDIESQFDIVERFGPDDSWSGETYLILTRVKSVP